MALRKPFDLNEFLMGVAAGLVIGGVIAVAIMVIAT